MALPAGCGVPRWQGLAIRDGPGTPTPRSPLAGHKRGRVSGAGGAASLPPCLHAVGVREFEGVSFVAPLGRGKSQQQERDKSNYKPANENNGE